MQFIKLLNDISSKDIKLVGGKASSLGEMTKADLPVPPGFVITTDAFEAGMNDGLEAEILEGFDALGAERVAVRSSAVAEDSKSASWAGQLETYLNVDRSSLIKAVKECWDSINSDHAREYAKQHAVSEADKAVGVVIQKMVESDVSGVMFTANPVTNNLDEIIIEAIYGLGELIVQGAVTPENFIINKKTAEVVSNNPNRQAHMLVYKDGKNVELKVLADRLKESTLDEKNIKDLINAAESIEKHYDSPQDIEWAIEGGKLYITQSRPITTLNLGSSDVNLEQEFVHQNGGDKVMRFEGDFIPFQLMIAWWNYIDSNHKVKGIDPVLFYFTPERTTAYLSHDKYNGAARETFSDLINGRMSLQEFKANYGKYSSHITKQYEDYFQKGIKPSSEKDYYEKYVAVHQDFHDLVVWTLFYEQLDEQVVAEVLADKNIDLKKMWEIVKLPVFSSFDTRKKEHILDALEGKVSAGYLAFAFTDYTFFADEEFVSKELEKYDPNELKAQIDQAKTALAKAKEQHEQFLKNTDEFTKSAIEILQWVLFCRDERKDIMNQVELLLFHMGKKLFEFWGIDSALLPYAGISDVLQGRDYMQSIKPDLPKRRDGFSVLYQTDRTTIFGYDDLQEQIGNLDNFILSQHQTKTGEIDIRGEIGNPGKAEGRARIIRKKSEFDGFQAGEILVTGMTRPEFVPLMQKAAGIITDEGGITSHAAIVSRELDKPCIIGTRVATQVLKNGDKVEVDANSGVVKILKSSTYTFEKIFTREETIIFGELQRNEFAKWLATITDEPIPTLFSRTDRGLVEVWLCNESTQALIDNIYAHNMSDPNYLEEYIKIYKDLMVKMAKMEKQKYAKSLDELKQYLELFRENMIPLHIIYFTPFHKDTPKHLNDLAIKIRSQDAMFDNADIFIRDSLVHLYPECDGYETFITLDELENPDLEGLKARTNGLFWLEGEHTRTDLEGFQKQHPNFVLKIDKIDPDQKTISGNIAYKGKVTGEAQVINLKKDVANFKPGNILVAPMTTPHYLPAMKHAKAFITDEGGVMCHAAIVAREMKTPCIIGTKIATQVLKNGDQVEVDANSGVVTIL